MSDEALIELVDSITAELAFEDVSYYDSADVLESDSVRAFFQEPDSPLAGGQIEFQATGPQFLIYRPSLGRRPKNGDRVDLVRNGTTTSYEVKQVMPDEGDLTPVAAYELDP